MLLVKKITYLNDKTCQVETMDNVIVASTKSLNNLIDNLNENDKTVKESLVKKQENIVEVYLDREVAVALARECASNMGLENNESLVNHIVKTLETGCIVERVKE